MTAVDILYPTSQAMELLKNQGTEHPVESSKYFCKICSKKFVSGRALGGHMRAHMPADRFIESEFRKSKRPRFSDDRSMENNGENIMFSLRKNPKHETQDEEEKRGDIDTEIEMEIDHPSGNLRRSDKWVKEKRFKTPRYALQYNPHAQFVSVTNNEDEDMALCLVMLASGVNTAQNPQLQLVAEQTGSGDLKLPNDGSQLPKCMRKKQLKYKKIDGDAGLYDDGEVKKGRYKCNSCNKVFHSHQALGGHRASHRKVRGYFSQITDDENETLEEDVTDEEFTSGSVSLHKRCPKERSKYLCVNASEERRTNLRIHKCPICDRVFPSGQALGGHKRCHWGGAGSSSDTVSTISSNKETPMQQEQMPARVELLDLNLPAPVDDDCDYENPNNLSGNAVDSHAQRHSPLTWSVG